MWFALLWAGLLLGGCADAQPTCRVGADCASGVCLSNGTCEEPPITPEPNPAEPSAPEPPDMAQEPNMVSDVEPDTPDEPDPGDITDPDLPDGSCQPNNDGIITRTEIPLQAGLHATFKVATNVEIDLAGTEQDGVRTWDFTQEYGNDRRAILEAQPLEGWWFAGDFPDGEYVSRLSETEDLLGIFAWNEDNLELLGIASPEEGFTNTKLTYDPPIRVLQLPLQEGDVWETDARVTGTALGVPSFYSESYRYEVDNTGRLQTPFGNFRVLRIAVHIERVVGLLPTTTRSMLFVTECFGTVASATSESGETEVEFTATTELRRLAP